jgi:hypothetical protein
MCGSSSVCGVLCRVRAYEEEDVSHSPPPHMKERRVLCVVCCVCLCECGGGKEGVSGVLRVQSFVLFTIIIYRLSFLVDFVSFIVRTTGAQFDKKALYCLF